MSHWISVTERLPESVDTVLIAYQSAYHASNKIQKMRGWSVLMARYAGGEWRFLTPKQKTRLPERIRFWMPIPDHPRELSRDDNGGG